MISKTYSVYIHTNNTNGKKYVGMTSQKPTTRWGKDGYCYASNKPFYEDIAQFGWGGFTHEVIESGLTKTQARIKEASLIALYNTTNPTTGYNRVGGKIF